jgi:disulfide bond formation protein DsbB
MISFIKFLSTSSLYWWLLLVTGIALESVALIYQYMLDYGPCPLCIHVRIGVAGFVLVSMLALVVNRLIWWRVSHLLNAGIMAWLSERAYMLLGTERGFVYTECGVDSGLPSWFPIDEWFPTMFGVLESCGYTPKLFFGISMAEVMMVFFPLMLLISLVMFVFSFMRHSSYR